MTINQLDNLTKDQHAILQKAKKALGQLAAEQTKPQAATRRLENRLEELKSDKQKTKITLDHPQMQIESNKH
jgi:hypothetical protein